MYRVIESPANGNEIAHEEINTEREALTMAVKLVEKNHNVCFVEKFFGGRWLRANRRFFWYFDRVCHYNY